MADDILLHMRRTPVCRCILVEGTRQYISFIDDNFVW